MILTAAFELLIRTLLERGIAVVNIEMFTLVQDKNNGIYEPHGVVLRHYKVCQLFLLSIFIFS